LPKVGKFFGCNRRRKEGRKHRVCHRILMNKANRKTPEVLFCHLGAVGFASFKTNCSNLLEKKRSKVLKY
jgi:hypothetical protein